MEEGLQYGEGDIPFDQVIPILNKYNDKTFAIEVWKGHEQGGHGFKAFLDKAIENGLVCKHEKCINRWSYWTRWSLPC